MDLGLKARVAIVTGGAGGIGRAICQTFAEEGANVVIADLMDEGGRGFRDEQGRSTEDIVTALGVDALYVRTDVSSLQDTTRLADSALQKYGRIDVLVNCAAWWRHDFFWEANPEDWRKELDVCLMGTAYCCRAVAPAMMKQNSGMIVNIASDTGRVGTKRQSMYGAAKAGVIGLTKTMALELGRYKVCVNCVSPSTTDTERRREEQEAIAARLGAEKYADQQRKQLQAYPLGRLGVPEDVANMVVFLSSGSRAGHITGQTFSVNGGFCML